MRISVSIKIIKTQENPKLTKTYGKRGEPKRPRYNPNKERDESLIRFT